MINLAHSTSSVVNVNPERGLNPLPFPEEIVLHICNQLVDPQALVNLKKTCVFLNHLIKGEFFKNKETGEFDEKQMIQYCCKHAFRNLTKFPLTSSTIKTIEISFQNDIKGAVNSILIIQKRSSLNRQHLTIVTNELIKPLLSRIQQQNIKELENIQPDDPNLQAMNTMLIQNYQTNTSVAWETLKTLLNGNGSTEATGNKRKRLQGSEDKVAAYYFLENIGNPRKAPRTVNPNPAARRILFND